MKSSVEPSEIIRQAALHYFADARVYLFGSRTRGDYTADSDFDVLIITDMVLTAKEKMPLRTNIRKDLLKKGIRSDIVIQNTQEASINQRLPGHFMKRILHEAILL
jgi:predicted nucleotidyltransferase